MNPRFSMFAIGLVLVSYVTCIQENGNPSDIDCRICDLSKCQHPGKCHVGSTRDACGCCEVCGLEEGHLCNDLSSKDEGHWHGFCGVNLECKRRTDVESKYVKFPKVCVCETKGQVCGSDGITYSPCQFIAAKSKYNITQKDDQPCETRPKIISFSESQSVQEGAKISLMCEVKGFPIPTVQWLFSAPGVTEPLQLPGDSEEVSVSVRGGPEKMRITAYLQITNFQLKHEGNYECLATGVDGHDTKTMAMVLKRKNKQEI